MRGVNTLLVTVELGALVLAALAIIAGLSMLREMAQHDRQQRERDGLPPRPGFFTRLRRYLQEVRRAH